ncbi:hypothetical protein Tco_1224445 [Tanacetum coccineum]
MTGNKSYLSDYEEIDGGFIAFGGDPKGGKITGKGKISTGKLDFEDVYFVKELKFNLFSVSQMCDKKNSVLFIDTGCVVLSLDFKLLDENDEAVNTACYVQNRVLVIKPHNKTPYELFLGRKPALSFMRPFGCPVTTLNTIDHLVEKNLHVKFSEETPNIAGNGPYWLFDIDALTKSMNYEPVVAGNQSNGTAGTKAYENAGKARVETVPGKYYILLPFLTQDPPFSSSSKDSPDTGFKPSEEEEKKDAEHLENEDSEVANIEEPRVNQEKDKNVNSTNIINTIVYSEDDEGVGAEADMNNLDTFIPISPILTTRIHKDHPFEQIIGDLHSAPQTRRMTKNVTEHVEPKKVIQALQDPSWIEAMQEELLQFKLQ